MNTYFTFPVLLLLNLDILIDGFQSVSSQENPPSETTESTLKKISQKLILVYPELEHFKNDPNYKVAVKAVEGAIKEAVDQERKLEKEVLYERNDRIQKQNSLNRETEHKLLYMSLIDMKEVAQKFVEDCYPEWKSPRRNQQLDAETIRLVLLNIENRRVLRLKKILAKNNLSDEEFIQNLQRFMSMRNVKAHLQLSSTERKDAYEQLDKYLTSRTDKAILEFLIADRPDLSSNAMEIPTSSPIPIISETAIRKSVDEVRVGFRLVEIPEYAKENDELTLSQAIDNFCKEPKLRTRIRTSLPQLNYRPIATVALKGLNNAYILFGDFQSAYALWNSRNDIPIPDKYRTKLIIKNITEEMPFNGDLLLKIEIQKSIFNDFRDKIAGSGTRSPQCKILTEKKDNTPKQTTRSTPLIQTTVIFCQFNSFEDTLLVYAYWKQVFGPQIKAKQITFFALSRNDVKKFPDLPDL